MDHRASRLERCQKITTYTYDDADRLTAVTDPASHSTQYAYDTENNLVSITDANGHVTSFGYDAYGRVTQTAFPSGLAESYAYDAVGNLISKTDRNGNTIQYLYDALDRLSHKGYPDSTGVDYVYDLVGKIKQVSDPTGSYGFAYDNMGRLIGTTTSYSFLPNQTFTNSYTYDAASNRTSLTAPDGSITTYGYDTLNRLNGLANSWAGSFGFGYDSLSRRTSLTRPNGVNTSYSYDSLSRLLSVLHQAGGATIDGASYTYDNAGNRTSKTNYLNGITENYTYDALYELTQVTQGANTTESYSYDPVGNRLSSLGVPLFNYNSSNELTSTTLGGYTYDNDGNTLTDASGKGYTWDFENRLSQVSVPQAGGGSTLVTFKYDPFGRRIQKSSPLGITDFLYDGITALAEMDNSGSTLGLFVHGAEIDEMLAESTQNTVAYYESDGQNSTTSMSSPNSAVLNSFVYDTFGKITSQSGTLANGFQYTGREADSETMLDYYRARYYDPSLGRFVSEDPTEFAAGANFYDYVVNEPTLFMDPLGLAPKCCPTRGKLPKTNVPYRMDMRQQPRPNMHVYWPDGTETVVNSNGGWDLSHGGRPLAKPPMCYRPNLRPVVRSFLERVGRMSDTALSVLNLLTIPLEEYNEQHDLDQRAKQKGRTPAQEFCSESHDAGDPKFYLSPVGPLPNPCNKLGPEI